MVGVSRRWVLGVGVSVVGGCAGDTQESHAVTFVEEIEGEDGGFVMDGRVSVVLGTAGTQRYPAVSVVLYDADREELDRVVLGKMAAFGDAPGERRVNISREYRPVYVVVESPGFWSADSGVSVVAFHWSVEQGAYEQYSVSAADEKFEVD